jgi:hypothetical protein
MNKMKAGAGSGEDVYRRYAWEGIGVCVFLGGSITTLRRGDVRMKEEFWFFSLGSTTNGRCPMGRMEGTVMIWWA